MDMKLELVAVPVSDVDKQPWGWFTYFSDPDGNRWACQQMVPQG